VIVRRVGGGARGMLVLDDLQLFAFFLPILILRFHDKDWLPKQSLRAAYNSG
jgi:hypothetical protein